MIITKENINKIPKNEQELVKSLLNDLHDINPTLCINWIDEHTEWSPERTDPCPDYYGMYQIKTTDGEIIGEEVDLTGLDHDLLLLYGFVNYVKNIRINN